MRKKENAITYNLTRRCYNSFDKIMSNNEATALLEKLSNNPHDAQILNKLTLGHMRIVSFIASKYSNAVDYEEGFSLALMGLAKSIKTYKINPNTSFRTYARVVMENEIKMECRNNKKHFALNASEISDIICTNDDAQNLDFDELCIDEEALSVEDTILLQSDKEELTKAINFILNSEEKFAISHLYGLNNCEILTQEAIAGKLGMSQSYISRVVTSAIKKIKTELNYSDIKQDKRLSTILRIHFNKMFCDYISNPTFSYAKQIMLECFIGINGRPKMGYKEISEMLQMSPATIRTEVESNLLALITINRKQLSDISLKTCLKELKQIDFSTYKNQSEINEIANSKQICRNNLINALSHYLNSESLNETTKIVLSHFFGFNSPKSIMALSRELGIPQPLSKNIIASHIQLLSPLIYEKSNLDDTSYPLSLIAEDCAIDARVNYYMQNQISINNPELEKDCPELENIEEEFALSV